MPRSAPYDTSHGVSACSPLPGVELPGQGVPLSTLQTVVMRYVTAGEMSPGRRILELGCGPGLGLEYLRECGARRVVGADRSAAFLQMARSRSSPEVGLAQCDAAQLPFGDGAFDVILLLEVLMYFQDPVMVLRECRRVLGPVGTVFLSLPNAEALRVQTRGRVERFYSADEVRGLLEEGGFRPEVFGVFHLQEGSRTQAFSYGLAVRILNGLERCGFPRSLRTRMTAAVRRPRYRLPFRVHSSHRQLLPVGDEGIELLYGSPDECRVIYARGVAAQR